MIALLLLCIRVGVAAVRDAVFEGEEELIGVLQLLDQRGDFLLGEGDGQRGVVLIEVFGFGGDVVVEVEGRDGQFVLVDDDY